MIVNLDELSEEEYSLMCFTLVICKVNAKLNPPEVYDYLLSAIYSPEGFNAETAEDVGEELLQFCAGKPKPVH
jgi:hypothetical protein